MLVYTNARVLVLALLAFEISMDLCFEPSQLNCLPACFLIA